MHATVWRIRGFIALLWLGLAMAKAGMLQEAINRANPKAVIELGAGVIEDQITIDKPLTIKGVSAKTTLRGSNRKTVVTIRSSHVRLENLRIEASGRRRDMLDAAIKMVGVSDVTIKGCIIKRTLFGIVAEESADLSFEGNTIYSYPQRVVDNRGDFIRLWGSRKAVVQGNRLIGGRDLSLIRSKDILVSNNLIFDARYGILASMDSNITIRGNNIKKIYAGIYIKGGRDISFFNNQVFDTRTPTGTGVLINQGKKIHIKDNLISGCSQALYIDSSPVEIGMQRFIIHNSIINNITALHFHAALRNNTLRNNDFVGNLHDVERDIPNIKRQNNDIELNFWDRYEGFDRNRDGIGDTPYTILIYADKLWQNDHRLKFFYATPILSLLDFIERLAPFDEPELLLKDPKPRIKRSSGFSFSRVYRYGSRSLDTLEDALEGNRDDL